MDKKILVVEDEAQIRLLLKRALRCFEENDVGLFFGKHGAEGLRIAKEEKPDIMLIDVMMPGMDGVELCKKVKTDPELKDTHVIFITAKGEDFDKEAGIKAGGDQYITKPFSPDDVIEKVENILHIGLDENSMSSGLSYLFSSDND